MLLCIHVSFRICHAIGLYHKHSRYDKKINQQIQVNYILICHFNRYNMIKCMNLVCLEEQQEVMQWVDHHAPQLSWHDSCHSREELLYKLCTVCVIGSNQVLPLVSIVNKHFGTSRNPAEILNSLQ